MSKLLKGGRGGGREEDELHRSVSLPAALAKKSTCMSYVAKWAPYDRPQDGSPTKSLSSSPPLAAPNGGNCLPASSLFTRTLGICAPAHRDSSSIVIPNVQVGLPISITVLEPV